MGIQQWSEDTFCHSKHVFDGRFVGKMGMISLERNGLGQLCRENKKGDGFRGRAVFATLPFILIALAGSASCLAADGRLDALAEASSETARASKIVRELQSDPDLELLDVLSAMKGKSEIAKNWYLSLAQTIADRDPKQAEVDLSQFLGRLSEDTNARYWALRYITRGNAEKREDLLATMLADPCPEIRYEAVDLGLSKIAEGELDAAAKLSSYQELLAAARLPEQIRTIANRLQEECDYKVDLLQYMGFLDSWQVVASFNNVDQAGFDVVYAPEKEYQAGELDFNQTYSGKSEGLKWQVVSTEADDGAVDLNAVFDNEKGAIAYLATDFAAASELDGQIRIGTPNACKVWLNGELLISREVYHAGSQIDQYVAPAKLKSGRNTILVKLCQNEQTQDWAQDWSFQLRFTDSTGVAVQPAN
jgi:hypothetical protein